MKQPIMSFAKNSIFIEYQIFGGRRCHVFVQKEKSVVSIGGMFHIVRVLNMLCVAVVIKTAFMRSLGAGHGSFTVMDDNNSYETAALVGRRRKHLR